MSDSFCSSGGTFTLAGLCVSSPVRSLPLTTIDFGFWGCASAVILQKFVHRHGWMDGLSRMMSKVHRCYERSKRVQSINHVIHDTTNPNLAFQKQHTSNDNARFARSAAAQASQRLTHPSRESETMAEGVSEPISGRRTCCLRPSPTGSL